MTTSYSRRACAPRFAWSTIDCTKLDYKRSMYAGYVPSLATPARGAGRHQTPCTQQHGDCYARQSFWNVCCNSPLQDPGKLNGSETRRLGVTLVSNT